MSKEMHFIGLTINFWACFGVFTIHHTSVA